MWAKLLKLLGKGVQWGVKHPEQVATAVKVVKKVAGK